LVRSWSGVIWEHQNQEFDYWVFADDDIEIGCSTGLHSTYPRARARIRASIIYKVGFTEQDGGRLRKQSKKRYTWTFQECTTASASASAAAPPAQPPIDLMTGPPILTTKTRSVSLVWSFTTGKQSVEMNGKEVWFGRQSGASVLSHSWKTYNEDGSVALRLEILATRRAPKHVAPNFCSHDLMLNGQIFEELPSIIGGDENMGDPSSTAAVSMVDLPKSIVEILYPEGYPRMGKDTSCFFVNPSRHTLVERQIWLLLAFVPFLFVVHYLWMLMLLTSSTRVTEGITFAWAAGSVDKRS
jgi:hypothetical protein